MIKASRIDIASATCFAIAFVLAKGQFILPLHLSSISNLLSLSLYFFGYILWTVAAIYFPENSIKKKPWLGIKQFKHPYLCAAILGLVATMYCIMAISSPFFLVPAAWIYFISNCFWCVTEIHKMLHPPFWCAEDPPEKQKFHLVYTSLISLLSLCAAIGTTLSFCIPIIAPQIFITSIILGSILGFIALNFWFAYILTEPSKKKLSYQEILDNLEEITPDPLPEVVFRRKPDRLNVPQLKCNQSHKTCTSDISPIAEVDNSPITEVDNEDKPSPRCC